MDDKKQTATVKYSKFYYLAFVLFFLLMILGFSPLYMHFVFGHVSPEALVAQLLTGSEGTPIAYYLKFALLTIWPALALALIVFFYLPKLFKHYFAAWSPKQSYLAVLVLAAVIAGAGVAFAESYTGLGSYIFYSFKESEYIHRNYVDSKNVSLVFPERKRNLIYIWSESMEASFQDLANGGAMAENLIPELTQLAKDNYSFSCNEATGGYYPLSTATFTLGSMVMQMGAIPYIVPYRQPNDTPEGEFIPGMLNLGDILEANGYHNVFFSGSSSRFAKQNNLFTQHGNYDIHDYNWLKEQGYIPQNYKKFWGVEDLKLFNFAKRELTKLAKEDRPFNFQLELMDTHGPKGLLQDGYSSTKYERQYDNVIAGASKMIAEFIRWVQQQEWASNTTIVLVGDHFTMAPNYHDNYVDASKASVYNCFINPLLSEKTKATVRLKNRKATTIDMLPTVLTALGVEVKGDRMGLGTNLFSYKSTLAERDGVETLNEAFKHRSEFYENNFLSSGWLIKPTKAPVSAPTAASTVEAETAKEAVASSGAN